MRQILLGINLNIVEYKGTNEDESKFEPVAY